MAIHASVTPVGENPVWLSGEDLSALQKEVILLIQKHGKEGKKVSVGIVVNGKLCRVSSGQQVFFMENPDGGAPLQMTPPVDPVFSDTGEVEFLVPHPQVDG